MRVGMHQINYFPWMGYFNKIVKSDKFILLDEVQLSDSGTMQRNRILNKNGEITYITVAFNRKDYINKRFCDIELNKNVDWQKRQYNLLYDVYHKFSSWDEVYELIRPVFEQNFETLQGVNCKALEIICGILGIDTSKFIYQSSLACDREARKSDLVLSLCKAVNADVYLSGIGAKKYMEMSCFRDERIGVQFQTFNSPKYEQRYSSQFVPGLSILDVLFNCGIEKTIKLFQENICNHEIDE